MVKVFQKSNVSFEFKENERKVNRSQAYLFQLNSDFAQRTALILMLIYPKLAFRIYNRLTLIVFRIC